MKKQKYILFLSLKLLVLSFSCWYIYREIFFNKNLEDLKNSLANSLGSFENAQILVFVVAMMFINWGVEAIKWKYLVSKIEKTVFIKSYFATLSGVTISVFTPNRVGEFLGKIFFLEKGDKIQGALSAILGSMSQMLVTLIFGSVSLLFFISPHLPDPGYGGLNENVFSILLALVILINIFSLILFFSSSALTLFLNKIYFLKRFEKYSKVFSFYSSRELFLILMLSAFRYLVFSFQFFLLLKLFGVGIYFGEALVLIPLVFLAVTMVPSVTPAEIGVREFFALQFIGSVSQNSFGIVSSTFALWIINLAAPALIGGLIIMGKGPSR